MKVTDLTAREAHQFIQETPELVILDLRTDEEFEMSFISGAVNYDCVLDGFETRLRALDRDTPYLIHCHTGGRSTDVLPVFEALGFTDIFHMTGGIREWASEDLPFIYNYYI